MITNQRIESYIKSLEAELPPLLGKIQKEAIEDGVPIIKKPTEGLLRFLIQLNKPEHILEIGTAVGFSSIFMSQYIKEGSSIVTIEKVPKRIAKAKKNIEQVNAQSKIILLEGDAGRVLKDLEKQEEHFDMVFMDGAKGQYLNFFPSVMRLLSVGGVLVSDNVLQEGDIAESRYAVTRRDRTIHFRMREYLYMLTHDGRLDTIILPMGDGIALSTKLKE